MMMAFGRTIGVLAVARLSACAGGAANGPEPLSIEFGQEEYLTDAYLSTTPGARCGPPAFAPGGAEAHASLPDGSWYRAFAIDGSGGELSTVVLERGVDPEEVDLTMRFDGEEGIVRLDDGDRRDAWGNFHAWADWMRGLGRSVQTLDCAMAEPDRR